jgi:hypothetical protein
MMYDDKIMGFLFNFIEAKEGAYYCEILIFR